MYFTIKVTHIYLFGRDLMNREINYDQLPYNNILCVDMKSFYASIEAVTRGLDPLKVLLAVVGDKERQGSVVLAATSALKEKYNIKTGDRLYEIPDNSQIKIVEAQMKLYLNKSMEITRLFNTFVPLEAIHVYSIDEAWLKLDGTERLLGNKWKTAAKIKRELKEKFGLPCSMGIGPNMFMAKVAMDIEGKKKGLVEWTYEDVPEKLWPVFLEDCWGIGKRLKKRLNKIGVKTVGDLAQLPLEYLENKFGIIGNQLYFHAWGVDLSKVEGHYKDEPQNLGRGITLLRDYEDIEQIKTVIFELAEEVAQRVRMKNLAGKTVSLGIGYSHKVKESGFRRQYTRKDYTNLTSDVFETCLQLLKENYRGKIVRKINVSLGNFISASKIQLSLFQNKSRKMKLCNLKDKLQKQYNYKALFYGRSLKKGSIKDKIKTTIGGHKA